MSAVLTLKDTKLCISPTIFSYNRKSHEARHACAPEFSASLLIIANEPAERRRDEPKKKISRFFSGCLLWTLRDHKPKPDTSRETSLQCKSLKQKNSKGLRFSWHPNFYLRLQVLFLFPILSECTLVKCHCQWCIYRASKLNNRPGTEPKEYSATVPNLEKAGINQLKKLRNVFKLNSIKAKLK